MTQAAEYAIGAAVYLARHYTRERVPADEIAQALGMPRNYLSKILYALAQSGLLLSTRGPRGGFRLSEAPADITLAHVIEPFRNNGTTQPTCLMGGQPCQPDAGCAAHGRWQMISEELSSFMTETTLAMLVAGNAQPTLKGGNYGDRRRA